MSVHQPTTLFPFISCSRENEGGDLVGRGGAGMTTFTVHSFGTKVAHASTESQILY